MTGGTRALGEARATAWRRAASPWLRCSLSSKLETTASSYATTTVISTAGQATERQMKGV